MDVLMSRCACGLITEKCESVLKEFLMNRTEMALPRDLVQQMGFTQLCASLKHTEVRYEENDQHSIQ